MNKIIMSAMLCVTASIALSSSRPTTPTKNNQFSFVINKQEEFDADATYVIGGDISTSDISIGLFKVVDNKPELLIQTHIDIKAEIGMKAATTNVPDFTKYFEKVYDFFKSKCDGLTVSVACLAAPGVTTAAKNYIKHHDIWAVDGREISEKTDIATVFVINDFEITGFGIEALGKTNIVTLHEGQPRENGTKLVLGAGNGFGSVLMLWNEFLNSYNPSPISYSYVDFFPYNEQEVKLMQYLQKYTGSRSCGKVLGGHGGVLRIYAFLQGWTDDEGEEKFKEFSKTTRYIDLFVQRKNNPKYQEAVDMYMKFYARCVRNAAYAQQPHRGVYITNTIADEFPELFRTSEFMQEVFNTNNGFLLNYVKTIPFYLVKKHDGLRMQGAALYAVVNAPKSLEPDREACN